MAEKHILGNKGKIGTTDKLESKFRALEKVFEIAFKLTI